MDIVLAILSLSIIALAIGAIKMSNRLSDLHCEIDNMLHDLYKNNIDHEDLDLKIEDLEAKIEAIEFEKDNIIKDTHPT